MNDGPVPDQQPLDRVPVSGSFVGLGSGQLSPEKEPLKQEHETGVGRSSTHCLLSVVFFVPAFVVGGLLLPYFGYPTNI